MPRTKYVPKHRNIPPQPALTKGISKSITYSGVAVAATGLAVTSGIATRDQAPAETTPAAIATADGNRADAPVNRDLVPDPDRVTEISRSADRRTPPDKHKPRPHDPGAAATPTQHLTHQHPREVARRLMPQYGLDPAEFDCLNQLWTSESDWNPNAANPTSTAYGIPQALTGGTHTNLPPDYKTNPLSQITWGLQYIHHSYGTACTAWHFKQTHHWY